MLAHCLSGSGTASMSSCHSMQTHLLSQRAARPRPRPAARGAQLMITATEEGQAATAKPAEPPVVTSGGPALAAKPPLKAPPPRPPPTAHKFPNWPRYPDGRTRGGDRRQGPPGQQQRSEQQQRGEQQRMRPEQQELRSQQQQQQERPEQQDSRQSYQNGNNSGPPASANLQAPAIQATPRQPPTLPAVGLSGPPQRIVRPPPPRNLQERNQRDGQRPMMQRDRPQQAVLRPQQAGLRPPPIEGAQGPPQPDLRPSGTKGRRSDERDGPRRQPARAALAKEAPTFAGKKQSAASRRSSRGQRKATREAAREAGRGVKEDIIEVGEEGMAVSQLAELLVINSGEVVKALFMKGIMVQVNQVLDEDTVRMVAEDYEVEVLHKDEVNINTMAKKTTQFVKDEDADHLQPRPPVVTVMGHVDHGKTSLLDFIRKTKVAAAEAGGITQAIGAYTCSVDSGESETRDITFLDTPGHEAFSAMRARGTKVTDIAIIVCAADDGVRPQTLEAISHAKAAGVPIVVAINKIDKEGAQVDRVRQELADAGLLPEEWGGQTPMVQISAKKGTGIDELLETVLLVAEVEELEANPGRAAQGTIIEAHLDKRAGAVATLLVQAGTLRAGDVVVASAAYGKVRSMSNALGAVEEAGPSIAVQMTGLTSVPVAGDEFYVCASESEARKVAAAAEEALRLERLEAVAAGGSMVTARSLASMDDEEDALALQRMNIILRADASGTLEAVKNALSALPQDRVVLRYLLAQPGEITPSDIDLAYASEATVVGFNVEPSDAVLASAKQQNVTIRTYKVIYDLLDEVRATMEGRLGSVEDRVALGAAEVRAVFGAGSKRVAGCMVTDGTLKKDCIIQVTRGRQTVYDGPLSSLKRMKDNVKEVGMGLECGVGSDSFAEWREGDKIEAFELVEKRRTLEEASLDIADSMTDSIDAYN